LPGNAVGGSLRQIREPASIEQVAVVRVAGTIYQALVTRRPKLGIVFWDLDTLVFLISHALGNPSHRGVSSAVMIIGMMPVLIAAYRWLPKLALFQSWMLFGPGEAGPIRLVEGCGWRGLLMALERDMGQSGKLRRLSRTDARNATFGSDDQSASSTAIEANRPPTTVLDAQADWAREAAANILRGGP
jgi:hypothetical protein